MSRICTLDGGNLYPEPSGMCAVLDFRIHIFWGSNMITSTSNDIDRLKDLAWLLKDIRVDLAAAVSIFRQMVIDVEGEPRDSVGVNRVCTHAIILQMCRLLDGLKSYGQLTHTYLTESLRKELNAIKTRIEERGYYSYRSSYLAHAISNHTKRAVIYNDAYPALKIIMGVETNKSKFSKCELLDIMRSYCNWVHNENSDCVTRTIDACISAIVTHTGPLGHRSNHA